MTDFDPLAEFRRKPAGGHVAAVTASAALTPVEGYLAFEAKDRPQRLRIRQANSATHSLYYSHIHDIIYDGDFGTEVVLIHLVVRIVIKGRNLQPVITALETGAADFIQEFDIDRWPTPTDKSKPFIESIKVMVEGNSVPKGTKKSEAVSVEAKG